MKKLLAGLCVVVFACDAQADNYIIGGIGLGETCATNAIDGDCRRPTLLLRGALGAKANEYFSLEGSLDGLVSSVVRRDYSHNTEDRVSVLTLGVHGLATLPLTRALRLFAGPSVGVSMARVSISTPTWHNNSTDETEYDDINTQFGVNYGWTAGVDIGELENGIVRLQWQNWRSVDSDVVYNGEFNTNYFSINFIERY